jgi:sugar lactone lactonase YvrE
MKADQLTGPELYHGEGPVWSADWGGLRCVDLLAGDVVLLEDNEGADLNRVHVGQVAAALRPTPSGGFVVGVERGIALYDAKFRRLDERAFWQRDDVRMNDGGTDPFGNFYIGSMAYDSSPGQGQLYRVTPELMWTVVLESVSISNGFCPSPDGRLAYYVDSPTQCVDVFDMDEVQGLSDRRTVAHIPEEWGSPDGLTVDNEGSIWVALWGGARVVRIRPDGRVDGTIELPVSQVSACTFGGPDLDRLYMTTSRMGPGELELEAGAIFTCTPGVTGLPAALFGR